MKKKTSKADNKIMFMENKLKYALPWIFFAFLIIWFGFVANHVIIYQSTLKLFFYDPYYLKRYFDFPGGFIDFCSSFLLQFYHFFWLGVIITALLNIGFYFLVRTINRIVFPKSQTDIISLLFSVLLFGLQNYHSFIPSYSLGFSFTALFLVIFLVISKKSYIASVFSCVIIAVILYFLTAGYVWIFAGMAGIYEISVRKSFKKLIIPALAVASPVIVSLIGFKFIYPVSPNNIWLEKLPFQFDEQIKSITILLGVLMILIPAFSFIKYSKLINRLNKPLIFSVLIVIVVFLISYLTFNSRLKTQFLNRNYVLNDKYSEIIQLADDAPSSNMLVSFGTNLSLYKKGLLLEKMFQYFQGFGINGLMLYGDKKPLSDLLKSKLYYDLGYINESHRWAFESLVQSGETPDALLFLAKTNMINGHDKIAEKYINLLDKSLFYKDTAMALRKFLNNEELMSLNNELTGKRKQLPNIDQFADNLEERNLEFLLKNHPENKMAFEYLQACRMLKLQVPLIVNNIREFRERNYSQLPASIQETCILYWASTGKKPEMAGYELNKNYMKLFVEYAKMVAHFRESYDKDKIYSQIKTKFGNTFWFYADFIAKN